LSDRGNVTNGGQSRSSKISPILYITHCQDVGLVLMEPSRVGLTTELPKPKNQRQSHLRDWVQAG